MVSHDMMLTHHMHEGIPLELNPVLKLLEMRKGCWRGICTTCLVSLSNVQMNRFDPCSPTSTEDDDDNDHAQIHSRRIESCAQAEISTTCLVSLSLSVSSAEQLDNGLRGRGHRITRPRGFLLRQGGGNSSATAIPTTTTCS